MAYTFFFKVVINNYVEEAKNTRPLGDSWVHVSFSEYSHT